MNVVAVIFDVVPCLFAALAGKEAQLSLVLEPLLAPERVLLLPLLPELEMTRRHALELVLKPVLVRALVPADGYVSFSLPGDALLKDG